MKRGTIGVILILIIIILCFGGYFLYRNWKNEISKIHPVNPSNLTATQITATQVILTWKDNSNNELGFVLYRDGEILATKTCHDLLLSNQSLQFCGRI